MTCAPLGDSAVVVTLGTAIDEAVLLRVRALAAALEGEKKAGIVDVVPAYTTVTVFYEIAWHAVDDAAPYERVCGLIKRHVEKIENTWPDLVHVSAGRLDGTPHVDIPVCYGGELGPDLSEVTRHTRLSAAEVIACHTSASYLVHAVGFAPGFPYLGGLPEKLFTPRRPTPRAAVPAGSVAIGWKQTGIYPLVTPGGWQLIGRTPVAMFRPQAEEPALLKVGDRVRFRAISEDEFHQWR